MRDKIDILIIVTILAISLSAHLVEVNITECSSQDPVGKIVISNMSEHSIVLIVLEENVITAPEYIKVLLDSRRIYPPILVSEGCVKIVLSHSIFHGEYELVVIMSYTMYSKSKTSEIKIGVGYLDFKNLRVKDSTLSGEIAMHYKDTLMCPSYTILELLYYPSLSIKSIVVVNGHFQIEVPENVENIKISCHGGYSETSEGKPMMPMIIVHDILTLKL